MSTPTTSRAAARAAADPGTAVADGRTRPLGLACLIGGLAGAASAAVMLATPPMVGPERFSYPFDATWHIVAETFFAVQHLTMLAGVIGLARLLRGRGSPSVRIGLLLTGFGVVALLVCEVLAITAAWEPLDSPWAMAVGSGYGIAMLLMGIGLLVAGIGIARNRLLGGWGRWLTLATGGYVFVVLFPAVFGPMVAGRLAIGAWLLLWAALGWAVAGGRARGA
jgi:hypothetical protein